MVKIRYVSSGLFKLTKKTFNEAKYLLSVKVSNAVVSAVKYCRVLKARIINLSGSPKRVKVPGSFQPLPHSYFNYHGPWIENYFFQFWHKYKNEILKDSRINHIYLPIFWTDYYIKHKLEYGNPSSEIQNYLDKQLNPAKKYFTIIQSDLGCQEKLPKNVLIFSAGGVGDIPIPLLKGRFKAKARQRRDILCSFMGSVTAASDRTGVRSKIHKVLQAKEGFYFGKGDSTEFINITSRSIFALCPRGMGRTSFRLYEVMQLGAIPIYIWDDAEWLPYKDKLNWDEFSVSINIKDIEKLPELIDSYTSRAIKQKQEKAKELCREYFTLEGTCNQIVRMLKEEIRFEKKIWSKLNTSDV